MINISFIDFENLESSYQIYKMHLFLTRRKRIRVYLLALSSISNIIIRNLTDFFYSKTKFEFFNVFLAKIMHYMINYSCICQLNHNSFKTSIYFFSNSVDLNFKVSKSTIFFNSS